MSSTETIGLLQLIMTAITAVIVIVGWFVLSHKNRKLQRKQLAIDILHQNRFQKEWTDSMSCVFKIIRNNPSFDWKGVAEEWYTPTVKISDENHEINQSIKTVLNYFEFVSVAVLNKAVDGDIVKWSYAYHYEVLNQELAPYIETVMKLTNDKEVFVNFLKLSTEWQQSKKHAKPT